MRVERQQSDYQRQVIAGLPQRAGGGLTPWATHCTTACPYQLPLKMPISAVFYILSSYRSLFGHATSCYYEGFISNIICGNPRVKQSTDRLPRP